MKDVQTIGEKASGPQREHTALQNNKVHSFTAFLFLGAIFACLDPNPESAKLKSMRIHADLDPPPHWNNDEITVLNINFSQTVLRIEYANRIYGARM